MAWQARGLEALLVTCRSSLPQVWVHRRRASRFGDPFRLSAFSRSATAGRGQGGARGEGGAGTGTSTPGCTHFPPHFAAPWGPGIGPRALQALRYPDARCGIASTSASAPHPRHRVTDHLAASSASPSDRQPCYRHLRPAVRSSFCLWKRRPGPPPYPPDLFKSPTPPSQWPCSSIVFNRRVVSSVVPTLPGRYSRAPARASLSQLASTAGGAAPQAEPQVEARVRLGGAGWFER